MIRVVTTAIITRIGYESRSVELDQTTVVTFVAQFFNTAFVPMIANANVTEQPLFGWLPGRGTVADFNS